MKKLITLTSLLLACLNLQAQDSLTYSKKQVADDIHYLLKNAADIHPNLYHDILAERLAKRADSLINKLPDSLSVLMAFRALSEATAFVNEGHTGLNTPKQLKAGARLGVFKMIPLQVTDYENGKFEGKLILPGQVKPVQVNSINRQSAQEIFKQLTALKGGLPSFRKVVAINNFRFFMAVIGIKAPYQITYSESGETNQTVALNGLSESDYNSRLTKPENSNPYTFAIVKNQYGYLNFKSMVNYDKFSRFCDSVFEVMDHRQIKKLIVDLRENSGGNSALGRPLLNYITSTPYRMAGESKRKVSSQFRKYILANRDIYGADYDGMLKLKDGEFYNLGFDDLQKPDDNKNKFKGKACFLIGPYTFSSANMLAATIKDYKLSTLIGEATGEPANDYGELCPIELPSTGLTGFTSSTFWVRPNNDTKNNAAIAPDYLVKKNSTGRDSVLDFGVKWLGK